MTEQSPRADEPALTAVSMATALGFAPRLAPAAVLVFDATLLPRTRFGRRQVRDPRPFRHVVPVDAAVSVVCASGPGAPTAAVTTEFLAALGVERIITIGTAGDLHGSLTTAAHPVAKAVSDEGTSSHYSTDLRADAGLTTRLTWATGLPALTTLTTDVPFRHTRDRLAEHRASAAVVEMECAAVFAVARCFGLQAASLLVAADRFDDDRWRPGDPTSIRRELRAAVDVAIGALA